MQEQYHKRYYFLVNHVTPFMFQPQTPIASLRLKPFGSEAALAAGKERPRREFPVFFFVLDRVRSQCFYRFRGWMYLLLVFVEDFQTGFIF